jgi:hypothetical protein
LFSVFYGVVLVTAFATEKRVVVFVAFVEGVRVAFDVFGIPTFVG